MSRAGLFRAPNHISDDDLRTYFEGASDYRAHVLAALHEYLEDVKGLTQAEVEQDGMMRWLLRGPLIENLIPLKSPPSHDCVVTERDNNYMAMCSHCLWAGPDRDSRTKAHEDGLAHTGSLKSRDD